MPKDNYFDNDGDIVSSKSVSNSVKPVFSSLLGKINEQRAILAKEEAERKAEAEAQKLERAQRARVEAPSFPSDVLEMINSDNPLSLEPKTPSVEETQQAVQSESEPPASPAAESLKESDVTVSTAYVEEEEPENEDLVDAIKAFSHKSGEKITGVAHTIKESTIAVAAVIEEKERTSSKLHRAIVICVMLLVTVIIFACFIGIFMHQMNKENERIKTFNTEAGNVCADYVNRYGAPSYENLYEAYGVDGYRLTGICFLRELDFDDDGISELMVGYCNNGVYYNEVWGFNGKNEFAVLFSEKATQSSKKSKDAYSTLYRKNNKYYIGLSDKKDLNDMALYQLRGDKFSKKYDCVYNSQNQSYEVDGKDDTTAFERIKYSVFKGEKAAVEAERAADMIEGYTGGTSVDQITAKQSRSKAYYSIIQDYNKRYGTAKYVEKDGKAYVEGLAVVDLIDFDGNGKNELLLVYRKPIKVRNEGSENYASYEVDTYYIEIYRYTGTKAVLAYKAEGLSGLPDNTSDKYYIIKKDGKKSYYCSNTFNTGNYGNSISASSTMYKFNKTGFTSFYSASYETDYGYTEYYLEGDEVRKSEFDEEGYKVALFNGDENKYDENVFKIVFVQRSLKKKGSLSNLPSETEKIIQELNPSYSAE